MTAQEALIQAQKEEIFYLKNELEKLRRLIYGQSSERFIMNDKLSGQMRLFEPGEYPVEQTEASQPTAESSQKKSNPKKAPRIVERNSFPDSLPREEQIIEPQGVDITNMVRIGEDVTEVLKYIPAQLIVIKIIRPRYVIPGNADAGVFQAPIPARLIPKGMVDESLIAELVIEKMVYHTPVHRFRKKLKQAGLQMIKENHLHSWFSKAAEALLPLHELLKKDLLGETYLQADESTLKVLSKDKPGSSHQGYMWLLHSPEKKATLFEYAPGRGASVIEGLLEGYKGVLQCDGYPGYNGMKRQKGVEVINCMAHARRKFVEASRGHPDWGDPFLAEIQKLYEIERQARNASMDAQARYILRQEKAVPILAGIKTKLKEACEKEHFTPQSLKGKAVKYMSDHWEGLNGYVNNGRLEIDNNWIENKVRPLALGRKNYLFSGSHDSASYWHVCIPY
jgi:transposase